MLYEVSLADGGKWLATFARDLKNAEKKRSVSITNLPSRPGEVVGAISTQNDYKWPIPEQCTPVVEECAPEAEVTTTVKFD